MKNLYRIMNKFFKFAQVLIFFLNFRVTRALVGSKENKEFREKM